MEASERLLIERECERLVTAYCHYVDHGEAERVADLFSEDGRWVSPTVSMEGNDQIRRGFAQRQSNSERMSRHVCNNFRLDIQDGDHAQGCVYLTLYRHDGKADRQLSPLDGPELIGEYRDAFVRTSAGWRIASREIVVSFLRASEK